MRILISISIALAAQVSLAVCIARGPLWGPHVASHPVLWIFLAPAVAGGVLMFLLLPSRVDAVVLRVVMAVGTALVGTVVFFVLHANIWGT